MAKTISSFPIDFDLYDDDYQQVLFITDDIAGQNLTLEVTNTSDKPVSPQALTGDATASNHHFELVFRPGTLYNVQPAISLKSDQFELFMDMENGNIKPNEDGTLSLFFKSKGNWTLQEGEKLLIRLSQIRAEATDGTRGTRVMLKYRNLLHAGNQDAFSGFREMYLNIVNHRGKKNIPLHIGFVGSNRVLNDGKSPNILKLRISNSSRKDIAIETSAQSKLILSMESGLLSQEWTMATDDQIKASVVRYSSAVSPKQMETTTGALTWEMPFVKLQKGAFMDVEISNLITGHPTGQATVFLHYENIPGYWDGEIAVVAEKAPLVFNNKNVGIGTTQAEGTLTVVPPGDGRGFEVLSPSAGNTHVPWSDNWNYISGNGVIFRDKSNLEKIKIDTTLNTISVDYYPWWTAHNKKFIEFKSDFHDNARGQVHFYAPSNYYENTPVITLAGNYGAGGKVGIGTGDPSELLEVSGNVKAASFIGQGAAVRGMIVMWSGAIDALPATWALCNGQNDTPDLQNRFIVGAGQTYAPGASGGQEAVALTEQHLPAHAHSGSTNGAGNHQHWIEGTDADGLSKRQRTIPGTTTVDMGFGGGWNSDPNDQRWRGHVNTDSTGQHSHSFSTNAAGGNVPHENRPPYYALAFIMKL